MNTTSGSIATIKSALRPMARWGRRHAQHAERYLRVKLGELREPRQSFPDLDSPFTLLLVPEAGLKPYYASHAIVAHAIQQEGQAVLALSCEGELPACVVKFAMRMPPNDKVEPNGFACVTCRASRREARARYGICELPISALLGEEARSAIGRTLEAFSECPWEAEVDGIRFGMICAADVLREQRALAIEEFTVEDAILLRALLRSALTIYFAVKTAIARGAVKRFVYFGDYAYWIAPQLLARRHGIPVTNLSHGYNRDTDRRYLLMRPGFAISVILRQVSEWPRYRECPIAPERVAAIADGALYRLGGHGGTTTYSPNWTGAHDLVTRLGLDPGKPTYVAYPSSSDEFLCAREHMAALGESYGTTAQAFADHTAWLDGLIAWMGDHPDRQLVVRFHPRMGVGHRHAQPASEYGRMSALFATAPPNVVAIWPEQPVSSYDLAEIADAALIAWSSMGLELARFGVPVVTAFDGVGFFPVGSFIRHGAGREAYFAAIEAAAAQPARMDLIREAFRWTNYLHWSPLIDVSDVIATPHFDGVPPPRRARNHADIVDAVVRGKVVSQLNMDRLAGGEAAASAEDKAVRAAVARMVAYFMTGDAETPLPHLAIVRGTAAAFDEKAGRDGAVLRLLGGTDVSLESGGAVVRRQSRLVARLCAMLAGERA